MRALITAEFPDGAVDELRALGYEPERAGWCLTRTALEGDALAGALYDAEILICEVERVDDALFTAVPTLRLVASCRGAPTNVDLAAAAEHGVVVLNTPGRNAVSVADFTMALLLTHVRRIDRAQAHLRQSGWMVGAELPYFHFRGAELDGRTLGLVGLGAIGRLVAQRAAGFGLSVLAYDPFVSEPVDGCDLVGLDELLDRSDIVSIHCPLTDETRGLIGAERLERMGPESFLVNTASAAIVDEQALLDALRSRTIAGAALDVFWSEPLAPDHPILGLDNVTLTPHVAGAANDVADHHARLVLDDIARWRRGEPLINAVVPPPARTS